MTKYSERLQVLIGTAPTHARTPDDPQFVGWKRDCEALVKKVYGPESSEFEDFRGIRFEWRGVATALHGPGAPKLFQESIEKARALLDSFFREQIEIESEQKTNTSKAILPAIQTHDFRRVFVVHGHDTSLKAEVARLIERLGLSPIILHEQPDMALTIIEKFEKHSEVGFAVVLLTPDDEGGLKGTFPLKPRARQNVVFEHGYFCGRLGRSRVMALKKEQVETPSDFDGVLYTAVDQAGAWMTKLALELKTAGYNVDLNRLHGNFNS